MNKTEIKTAEEKILKLIDDYWKFDEYQKPQSSWHEKQALLKEVEKAFALHPVSMPSDSDIEYLLDYHFPVKNLRGETREIEIIRANNTLIRKGVKWFKEWLRDLQTSNQKMGAEEKIKCNHSETYEDLDDYIKCKKCNEIVDHA